MKQNNFFIQPYEFTPSPFMLVQMESIVLNQNLTDTTVRVKGFIKIKGRYRQDFEKEFRMLVKKYSL